ncbi:TetR/AcrR family transcriptional regulator [Zongyangia hominis]|uniref:TetR/AcrR family transcriptional regulator n=1 Tax=Zongyangia hominis TaxID=2763677 RepID=A0A926EE32_9FIRM|nr:TetR/AcrR family transcriptional regulator [Zongyangia hominis]MBC8570724.1 TetR/AcrR family transcriptional regulator [Zongyangia hominis]
MANNKKQEIIDTYIQLIVEKGIEKASLNSVAARMGIPQSLVFHYFKNKDALIETLTDYIADICKESYRHEPKLEDKRQEFLLFVRHTLNVHEYRRSYFDPVIYSGLIYLSERNAYVKQKFIELTGIITETVCQKLREYAALGIISTDDLLLSARTLLCMADGILSYRGLIPDEGQLAAFLQKQEDVFLTSVSFVPAK